MTAEDEPTPDTVVYTPIGVIRSCHSRAEETPIQPVFAAECAGSAVLYDEYAAGLKDLDGFSHVILIYHMHVAGEASLVVRPFMGDRDQGVFSTRHPRRPNPIGFSVVRLEKIEGTTLHLQGVDVLDGTPLLDIKPYVPKFDNVAAERGGWTEAVDDATARRRGRRGYRGGEPQ